MISSHKITGQGGGGGGGGQPGQILGHVKRAGTTPRQVSCRTCTTLLLPRTAARPSMIVVHNAPAEIAAGPVCRAPITHTV